MQELKNQLEEIKNLFFNKADNNILKLKLLEFRQHINNTTIEHLGKKTKQQKSALINIINNIIGVFEKNYEQAKEKEILEKLFERLSIIVEDVNTQFVSLSEISEKDIKTYIENAYEPGFLEKLEKLNGGGFLVKLFPEWEKIANDTTGWSHRTHDYRIDEHTFETLNNLRDTKGFNDLSTTLKKILSLTLFFHDIGKDGGNAKNRGAVDPAHPKKSEIIALEILKRLGYDKLTISIVCKLIRFHQFFGTIMFRRDKHSTSLIRKYETIVLTRLGDPLYLDLLRHITIADIGAVKKEQKFMKGYIQTLDFPQKTSKLEAIDITYDRLMSRMSEILGEKIYKPEEAITLGKLIFKDGYPKGNKEFLFYLLQHWDDVLSLSGTTNRFNQVVKDLFQLEKYIRLKQFKQLKQLRDAVGNDFPFLLSALVPLQEVIIKHDLEEIIRFVGAHKDVRAYVHIFPMVLEPRLKILIEDKDAYKTLFTILEECLRIKRGSLIEQVRATNSLFNYYYTSGKYKDTLDPDDINKEIIQFISHKSGIADMKKLKKEGQKTIHVQQLHSELNINELNAIKDGQLPMCYYHSTPLGIFAASLEEGLIIPSKLKIFHNALKSINPNDKNACERKIRLLRDLSTIRTENMERWKKELNVLEEQLTKEGRWYEVRSKYFVQERMWFKFLGAPPPYNAKEDFYTIFGHYFDPECVILELTPLLYKFVDWESILPGGLAIKEKELIHFGKLTRDLVVKKSIPTNMLIKIFAATSKIKEVKQLINQYNLNIEVIDISLYAQVYQEELNNVFLGVKALK